MFDIWMRLLERVPGSVLWLLETNSTATANLRREAEVRLTGGSARLVFAPTLGNPEHLARFAVADLFLDTLPYNAHTAVERCAVGRMSGGDMRGRDVPVARRRQHPACGGIAGTGDFDTRGL